MRSRCIGRGGGRGGLLATAPLRGISGMPACDVSRARLVWPVTLPSSPTRVCATHAGVVLGPVGPGHLVTDEVLDAALRNRVVHVPEQVAMIVARDVDEADLVLPKVGFESFEDVVFVPELHGVPAFLADVVLQQNVNEVKGSVGERDEPQAPSLRLRSRAERRAQSFRGR